MKIFFYNILLKYQNGFNNKYILTLIIILYKINIISALIPYKLIYFEQFNKMFSISDKSIIVYIPSNLVQIKLFEFTNDQSITTLDESKMISSCYFYYDNFQEIYLIIKNYIYFYSYNDFKGNLKIENITNSKSNMISYECIYESFVPYCYFFIAIIDNNKNLKIFKHKLNLNSRELYLIKSNIFELKNSYGNKSKSQCDNVSCQLMSYSSNKVLTCFYENKHSELCSININIDTLEQDNLKGQKCIKNSEAIHIKSVLFNNNQKAFVCYINNKNNIACIIYEINENQWLIEYKYIEECNDNIHLFNLDYYYNRKLYILSCYTSSDNIEYAIFNYQFDINDNSKGNYCLTNIEIEYCESGLTSSIITYDTSSLYIERVCAKEEFENLSKYDLSESCNKNYNKEKIVIEETEGLEPIEEIISSKSYFSSEPEYTHVTENLEGDNIKIKTNKTLEVVITNLNIFIEELNISKIYEIK